MRLTSILAVSLVAIVASPVPISAQTAPPAGSPSADTPAPVSRAPLSIFGPRPKSPIPRAEGARSPPNAAQIDQWMEALRAAWRAGRCEELSVGMKEMRSWIRVLDFQIDGLKGELRSAGRLGGNEGQYRRDQLTKQIQEIRKTIYDVGRELDRLKKQPCPPPPSKEKRVRTPQPESGDSQRPERQTPGDQSGALS